MVNDDGHKTGLNRREVLRLGAMAGLGATINTMSNADAVAGIDFDKYDGLGLASLVAKKQASPQELLDAARRRVEAINPRINAFSQLFFDKAEEQIRKGLPEGPFKGVPFVLKDLGQYLTGTITSAGSRLWKNSVADYDSTLVQRYKKAGLVIFGKTTSPELGLTTTTESVLYGKTRNPWSLELTSGGSSGGSSAAVASRIVPMAHASDGGGSIRVPASCCGLFGFKPTRGRIPLGPAQFEGWNGFSAHHAITISVRDCAALMDATAGAETGSPFFSPPPATPFLREVGANPGRLRIALFVPPSVKGFLHPECARAASEAARLCESLGHHVEESLPPLNFDKVRESFLAIFYVSIARVIDDAGLALGRSVSKDDIENVTWATYQAGRTVNVLDYSRAIANTHQIGLAMARYMEKYDVILSPTLAKPPLPLGLLSLSQEDVSKYGKEVTEFSPFTSLYNVTGQPSMSVPLHWTADGLPVGVMFSGRFGEDATLLRLASQLEKAKPWAAKRPTIS